MQQGKSIYRKYTKVLEISMVVCVALYFAHRASDF